MPSNHDVSGDSSVAELQSTTQSRKFLESQLHNTCVIQFDSIQVSIKEVLAQNNMIMLMIMMMIVIIIIIIIHG